MDTEAVGSAVEPRRRGLQRVLDDMAAVGKALESRLGAFRSAPNMAGGNDLEAAMSNGSRTNKGSKANMQVSQVSL